MKYFLSVVMLSLIGFLSGCAGSLDKSAQSDANKNTNIDNADGMMSFISCPVYRDADAGPKSGCWLSTDRRNGKQFDVSRAPSKPLLGKAILVEGVMSDMGDEYCGAPVLDPVRVSVLNEPCPEFILPGENFKGHVFSLPKAVMRPTEVPRELPEGPYSEKHFSIVFHYGSDFLNYQYSEVLLEKIALYIKASNPKHIVVTGYSASQPYFVSGRSLIEPQSLARSRADMVLLALTRLGVSSNIVTLKTNHHPEVVDGLEIATGEPTRRRVDIAITLK